jgi:hypothetical protein
LARLDQFDAERAIASAMRASRTASMPARLTRRATTASNVGMNKLLARVARLLRTRRLRTVAAGVLAACSIAIAVAGPRPFHEYPGVEHADLPLPPDYMNSAEWTFARLMYPPWGGGYGAG